MVERAQAWNKKDYMTPEEDTIIVENVLKYGKKWAMISRLLDGRTENDVKNRYNSLINKEKRLDEKEFKEQQFENSSFYSDDRSHISLSVCSQNAEEEYLQRVADKLNNSHSDVLSAMSMSMNSDSNVSESEMHTCKSTPTPKTGHTFSAMTDITNQAKPQMTFLMPVMIYQMPVQMSYMAPPKSSSSCHNTSF